MQILDKVEINKKYLIKNIFPYYYFKYKDTIACGYFYKSYDEETIIKAFLTKKQILIRSIVALNIKLSQYAQAP